MACEPAQLRAILRLAVEARPATETMDVHGWSWRASGGGSKRYLTNP